VKGLTAFTTISGIPLGCHGIANKDGCKSLNKIGKELGGLTVGGMSQIRKRLKEKMQKDNSLRFKYNHFSYLIQRIPLSTKNCYFISLFA
jgi:hypothetical protein